AMMPSESRSADTPAPPSSPTRRPSDLPTATAAGAGSRSVCRALGSWAIGSAPSQGGDNRAKTRCDPNAGSSFCPGGGYRKQRGRSEEHTSELQSRENLVCRLLLEKKKG